MSFCTWQLSASGEFVPAEGNVGKADFDKERKSLSMMPSTGVSNATASVLGDLVVLLQALSNTPSIGVRPAPINSTMSLDS